MLIIGWLVTKNGQSLRSVWPRDCRVPNDFLRHLLNIVAHSISKTIFALVMLFIFPGTIQLSRFEFVQYIVK